MNQNYIVNLKNIKLVKSTCPFYNYIFFREILLLLNNKVRPRNIEKEKDFITLINKIRSTICDQMNALYSNTAKNGRLTDDDKEKLKTYILNKSLNTNEIIIKNLNIFFQYFLKLSPDDDVKKNFFFNLIDNKENLIILPTYIESEIDGLKSYFDSCGINQTFFSDYFHNKQYNNQIIDSEYIKKFDEYAYENIPFYKNYQKLLDKYDKADNIFYLPCITKDSIDKDIYTDIINRKIKELNKKISENYQIYSSDYLKQTTIIVDKSPNIKLNIYKNIYMFFDDNNTISTKFFNIQRTKYNNSKSIAYMNEIFIKSLIDSYDDTDIFNRKIIVNNEVSNQMNSLIDYSLINKKYNKDIIIRYYNNNIDNKSYTKNLSLVKATFYFLFTTLNFIINNQKIQENIDSKNINKLIITLNINKKIEQESDTDFKIKFKESSKSRKQIRTFMNSYTMNFFNFNYNMIDVYIEKSDSVFNPLYVSKSDLTRYIDIFIQYNTSSKTRKNNNKKLSNKKKDILAFIILYAYRPGGFNTSDKKYISTKNTLLKYIKKKYSFTNNVNTEQITLCIRYQNKNNINIFDLYLKNNDSNKYFKLEKYSGYFTKKVDKVNSNYLTLSTLNITKNMNNNYNIFEYYNNLFITRKALKSYIKYYNLNDDIKNVLLKILTNKNELDSFYNYHVVIDELKKYIIDKSNYYIDQTKIVNNIINILLNSNQEIYFEKSTTYNKYLTNYEYNGDITKETKIIDTISTINDGEDPKFPLFILKEKNNKNKFIMKNYTDDKKKITDKNFDLLKEFKDLFKDDYNLRQGGKDTDNIYKLITDSKIDTIAIINLNIKNSAFDNKDLKCDEKKKNITNKLKKYFKDIKNNITLKKLQYIG